MCEIDLSDVTLADLGGFGGLAEVDIHGSGADVKDCFFQMSIDKAASWFGFDHPETAADWASLRGVDCRELSIWDDERQAWETSGEHELPYPCMRVMPMGWSWALYFANEIVTHCAERAAGGAEGLLRDKTPGGLLAEGSPVSAVYVDAYNNIAGS